MKEKKEVDKTSLDYLLFGSRDDDDFFSILRGIIGWIIFISVVFGCC